MGIRWRAWHGTPPRFAPERIDSFFPEAGERAAHARAPVLHLQFTARYTPRFFREFNSLNKWQRRTREPKGTPANALQTRRRRHSQSTHRRRWTAPVSSLGYRNASRRAEEVRAEEATEAPDRKDRFETGLNRPFLLPDKEEPRAQQQQQTSAPPSPTRHRQEHRQAHDRDERCRH